MTTDLKTEETNSDTDNQPRVTLRGLLEVLFERPRASNEQINLRAWFAGFLGYMVRLAGGVYWGLYLIKQGNVEWGTVVWVIAAMMFYLSLCCTVCPLPTTWLILAVGSGGALAQLIGAGSAGELDSVIGGWAKVGIVAVLGGLATTMANLNEYHIFTFLLRYRPVSKVRQTRLYDWAGRWYNKEPFLEPEQERLMEVFKELDERGCKVMLSNSHTSFIMKLYDNYSDTTFTVSAGRSISCNAGRRGPVNELVVTNYQLRRMRTGGKDGSSIE